jgi:serine/threonine-protein kinase HipA
MVKAAVFNVILGNADAHAKNFSLLYADEGIRLAPLYDLMSTAFYPALAPGFAMKIGRATTMEDLGPRDWQGFAERVDLGFQIVQRQVQDLSNQVSAAIPSVLGSLAGQGLDQAVLDQLGVLVQERAERCPRALL